MTRTDRKNEIIKSLTKAQEIAFAPLSFQAIAAMIDLGIMKSVDSSEKTQDELMQELGLSEYTVSTLLEVASEIGVVQKIDNKYSITHLGQAFLYDEMTRVNFNFVKDVCYLGADKLTKSFLNARPEGLETVVRDAKGTIYPYLSKLPEKARQSWYEFDHYYSDNCFDMIYKIISPVDKIFDIGGNTGKFEKFCLKSNPNQDITMIDLAENIDFIKNDKELNGCKFVPVNVLDESTPLPAMAGAVFMSQFLDCFSKEQIVFILKRVMKSSSVGTKIYILEPFTDRQKFDGARFSLVHTSLYFTCMANGYSKMYSQAEMEEMVKSAGLTIVSAHENLGVHDYTLLECVKND